MISLLILIAVSSGSEVISCSLGIPVTVEYPIPDGWTTELLESSENWHVLEQNGGTVILVPLSMDTISLPQLRAHSDSLYDYFPSPVLLVQRTMPDSTWAVSLFPSPVQIDIPEGFPEDYLNQHRFWEEWRKAPSDSWLLYVAFGLIALISLSVWLYYRRKKKRFRTEDAVISERTLLSPVDEAKALLDSQSFAEGDWIEYYRCIDKLLRDTVSFRFRISNRALTWNQIIRLLRAEDDGGEFSDESDELIGEISLQRYAAWGGSRDRAERFTLTLASIRREWHIR